MLWEGEPLGVPALEAEPCWPRTASSTTRRSGSGCTKPPAPTRSTSRLVCSPPPDGSRGCLRAISDTPERTLHGICKSLTRTAGMRGAGLSGAFVRSPLGFCRAGADGKRALRCAHACRREVDGVKVLLAAPRSFCAGVDRAIEIVERLLEEHGPPVYVRHEIVHNDNVVRRLEGLGAVFVESEDEIPPGEICVLSAHGSRLSSATTAERAACGSSTPSARSSRRCTPRRGGTPTPATSSRSIGHADHVEVIGTKGERPEQIVVVESPEDAEELDTNGKPLAVISQTTLSLDDVASTVDALERRFGELTRPGADDICYATQNRQDAVKEIARLGGTLILVIGSPTSSNAKRLVEVARGGRRRRGARRRRERARHGLLPGHEIVGLTAGASTPEELVQGVLADLAARGYETWRK